MDRQTRLVDAHRRAWPLVLAVALTLVLVMTAPAPGQAIPRDQYLRYVPLEYPPLVERTEASRQLSLFGDPDAPDFRDEAPRDGIDDARGERLRQLGARFGPIMVLNTADLPLDFRRYQELGGVTDLYVDTWDLIGHPQQLVRSDTIAVRDAPDDSRLLDLLHRYAPGPPDAAGLAPRSVRPDSQTFEVLFVDMPGEDPGSWRRAFANLTGSLSPAQYHELLTVYVHPFVYRTPLSVDGEPGYELVLQYYFFYPTNDGGNNHEGDWEHINVSIGPRNSLHRPLTAGEVQAILVGDAAADDDPDDPLVIRHVDYYFHHQVFRMDYTTPDAYAPRDVWRAQYEAEVVERHGQQRLWTAIRHNAWWDDAETELNTHPICYVGADNKGLDQVLSAPGGKNRDSHGTYPFPGLYKDIGPGGATEQINSALDHRRWRARRGGDVSDLGTEIFGRGDAVPYTTVERIKILPDWELVVEPVMTDPDARRDWHWMLLPIRWGYPAVESPFAGVVPHAETGNLAPFGPMSQPHWNRPGTAGGSNEYLPHSFETLFPLGLQDTFVNSWGYLNLTLPVIAALPPIDFAWRLVAYPFRLLLQRNDPVYFPTETIPSRFVGLNVGASSYTFNDDTATLMFNGLNGREALVFLLFGEPDAQATELTPVVDRGTTWWWQVNFYLGDRFVTQNTLLHGRSGIGADATFDNGAVHRAEAELNLWEYAGSFRYDLTASTLRPFLKLGYGWTWYRVEGTKVDGEPMPDPDGEWINRPSFDSFSSILPNSWHGGAGLEFLSYRSGSPFPNGVDVSLVGEVTYTQTSLGLDAELIILGSGDLSQGIYQPPAMKRWTYSLGLTLGF
jgi:hypothetical protein